MVSKRQQTISEYFSLTKISSATSEMREWKSGLKEQKTVLSGVFYDRNDVRLLKQK